MFYKKHGSFVFGRFLIVFKIAMTSQQLRSEFLNFFKDKGHKIVPSSSLIPDDPSVLLTTAGMQQFKKYFLGEADPKKDFGAQRTASIQKSFRTSDIDEVGDETHDTFFEMLGHFSFGDYFKKETIEWTFEFLAKVLKISTDRITVTVFEGDGKIPFDEESYKTWLKFLPEKQIKKNPRKDNVWGPVGDEGPCGAANEVYVDGLEVATLVFVEYFCAEDGSLTPLAQKGVDVGWGLERVAMIAQGKKSIFEADLFEPLMAAMPAGLSERKKRIAADHSRGIVFLVSDGVRPFNKEAGYILRRLLRRLIILTKDGVMPQKLFDLVVEKYKDFYTNLDKATINAVFDEEYKKFDQALNRGVEELGKMKEIDARNAFKIYESFGLPYEVIKETGGSRAAALTREDFEKELVLHQEVSRAGAEKKFKGGLADDGVEAVKYHTATHLLLAALREVLGPEIYQKGSNITAERLRFDFNYPQKMTDVQIKKVEEMVNQKIKEDILVEIKEMPKNEALKIAKVSFDPEKYGETVKVYQIGDFSIELCAGPHVKRTSELGVFKITKEESSSAGVRRIRAILESREVV
ncbi:MAG: alanine--tRNA ligase [Candidatus Nealsonbacteria bacterium]